MTPTRTAQRALVLALVCWFTGCAVSSPPIQHLQLSTGTDTTRPDADRPLIMLDAVRVPDYLLRDELLLRSGPNTLRYDPLKRWAEPLDLGIQRVIARRLESLLNTRGVVLFPDAPRRPVDWELRIDIEVFEVIDSDAVLRAEGRWTSTMATASSEESVASDDRSVVVVFEESVPTNAMNGGESAAALSVLLWRFSDALAEPLTSASTRP